MEFDQLILGPFVFADFSPPEQMPLGTKQQLNVHKMPGGFRTVDVMGPDDNDPQWCGFFFNDDALTFALTLYAMCQAGQELPFTWGAETRTVVIAEFNARVEKPTYVHYDIRLVYTDDSGQGAFGASPGLDLASSIVSDLSTALSFAS